MDIIQTSGTKFSGSSNTARGGSVTITQAASANRTYYVTDLSASAAESTAVISVFSSGTNFWQNRLAGTSGTPFDHSFVSPIRITTGSAFTVRVMIGTINGETGSAFVNVAGYYI